MLDTKKILITGLGMLVVVCPSLNASAAIELTTNGGFETGDFTGWTQFETAVGNQTIDIVNPSSGSFSAKIDNAVEASNSLMKQANLAPGLLTAGQTVYISFDARGSLGVGAVSFAEFFTEIDGGGTSSAEILGGGPLALDPDPDTWKTFVFSTVVGPDSSGGVTLQLGATVPAISGSTNTTWYDNASVSVDFIVPEPTSFVLAALGLLGIGFLRRKQA